MLYLISTAVLFAASVFLVLSTRERRFHIFFLLLALLFQAQVVLVGRTLSAFGLLDETGYWLVAEIVLLIFSIGIWKKQGSPCEFEFRRPDLSQSIRLFGWMGPATAGLAFVAAAIYGVLLVATVIIPQNMDDVLTAYLPRIGYWLQSGDFSPYPASPYNSVQVSYPLNAQIPPLRSIVLSGGSNFVGIDQWLAALLSGVAVYGLGVALGAKRALASFTGLIWVLSPAVIAQAGIMLTDITSVWGFLTILLFGILGWREQRNDLLGASSLALALLIGSKQTVFFMLPGLALVALAVFVFASGRKRVLKWGFVTGGLVLWFGVDRYIMNWRYFGHPLGEEASFGFFASEVDLSFWGHLDVMITNIQRTLVNFAFADLNIGEGHVLAPMLPRLQSFDPHIGTGSALEFGVPWIGTFVTVVLAVGVLCVLFKSALSSVAILLVPAISFVFLFHWIRTNYSLAFARYMMGPVALGLVVAAIGLSLLAISTSRRRKILGLLAVLLAAGVTTQAIQTATANGIRPLWGENHVWGNSSNEMLALSNGFRRSGDLASLIERVDDCFISTAKVGMFVPSKFPQAALFGDNFSRRVTQYVFPEDLLGSKGLLNGRHDVLVVEKQVLADWAAKNRGAADVNVAGVALSDLELNVFGSFMTVSHETLQRPGCERPDLS